MPLNSSRTCKQPCSNSSSIMHSRIPNSSNSSNRCSNRLSWETWCKTLIKWTSSNNSSSNEWWALKDPWSRTSSWWTLCKVVSDKWCKGCEVRPTCANQEWMFSAHLLPTCSSISRCRWWVTRQLKAANTWTLCKTLATLNPLLWMGTSLSALWLPAAVALSISNRKWWTNLDRWCRVKWWIIKVEIF